MESIILEEVNKLVKILEGSNANDVNGNLPKHDKTGSEQDRTGSKLTRCRKKSTNINQTLSVAVVNSLWSILTGEKISHGDKRVRVKWTLPPNVDKNPIDESLTVTRKQDIFSLFPYYLPAFLLPDLLVYHFCTDWLS